MDTAVLVLLLKSAVMGLSIAAPVGPIGLLTIQRTLDHGRAVGLATGLGAAAADAVYGAIGAYGVTAVMSALGSARTALALGGGLFLLWLGVQNWRAAPVRDAPAATAAGATAAQLGKAFGGTFVLTLSNPATVLSFIAIFAALAGAQPQATGVSPAWMVLGVLAGSALWWLALTTVVALLRQRLSARAMQWVRRGSGALLMAFGLYQLWGLWELLH